MADESKPQEERTKRGYYRYRYDYDGGRVSKWYGPFDERRVWTTPNGVSVEIKYE